MIRALVFDCFGVLYQGSRNYLFDRTPTAKHDELHDLNVASDYGFVSYNEYVRQASALASLGPDELERIFSAEHQRNEQLVTYVRYARDRGFKTALLSNVGRDVMDRLFAPSEQAELFDAVVLSSDVASIKPHPQMYETVAMRLEVEPEACVMIDDIQTNVDGALAVGMQGVCFVSTEQTICELDALVEGKRA